ncbi:40S small subunit processome assembly factor 1 [Vipera latastei]
MVGLAGRQSPSPKEDQREDSAFAERLLDTVLSSLYDFGESPPEKCKKKRNKKRHTQQITATVVTHTVPLVNPELGTSSLGKKKNVSNFFDNLKDELASVDQKKCISGSSSPNPLPFKSAQEEKATQVEVVTFHSRHRKKIAKLEIPGSDDLKAKMTAEEPCMDTQEFNLEKARLEVHRLGITGFTKKEQRVLEQERAIMLGAKPSKKEYVNYKILQEQIKEKQAAKKKENMTENKSDSLKRRKKRGHEERKSKKTTKQNILPTGRLGKFKNGTLILQSCDIRKIKSSKLNK